MSSFWWWARFFRSQTFGSRFHRFIPSVEKNSMKNKKRQKFDKATLFFILSILSIAAMIIIGILDK